MPSWWNPFNRPRRRQQSLGYQLPRSQFPRCAPPARGTEETLLAASSGDNLGAVAALRQVIQANSPHRLSSQTVEWAVVTLASGVSADSEDYIRNPYTDLGRRPPKKKNESVKSESPVAVSPPQSVNSVGDEDLEVISRDEGDQGEETHNLLRDPFGTLLHVTAAATLASGPRGRLYITSGPPPADQMEHAPQASSQLRPLLTPSTPAPPALTRPRAASSPVRGDRSQSSGSMAVRSVRTW
ncbi:hypothetical protein N8I77_004132 [Diaporthe amygdali]|uniref:Uncharacterized protein n=1 Tax=Phomopsis amygdali TaxID=1214568 RepID=A0AAD9SLM8_PHOAM|nr:hypothetical protein N8I77_004132 [Diaporthe amygdali]